MDLEDSQDNDTEIEFTNIDVRDDNINYSNSCSSDSETSDVLQTKKKRVQTLQYSSDSESDTVSEPDSDNDTISESSWIVVSEEEDELPAEIKFSVGNKNIGLQFQDKDFEPIDFFKRFFTDKLIADIVKQTNIYARQKINSQVLKRRSMWNNWKEVTVAEMCAFIGVILNMGTITLHKIEEYFSQEYTHKIPFFCDIFSRERFLQIFWMLHLNENISQANDLTTRTKKVSNYMEYLNSKFQDNFIPSKEISIDEAVVQFKGRISFITYNPNKPTKWGIRLYVLADSSTGYVYSVLPYYGALTSEMLIHPELPVSSRIVLHLVNNLLESVPGAKGYHIYTDRYYTSIPLANELLKRKCYITGTIQSNRKLLPKKVSKPSFVAKTYVACRKNNMLALAWKDKRVVSMLSSNAISKMQTINRIRKCGDTVEIRKPQVILNYNKFMGGVDLADHYGSTYCFLRKSIKWWRKLFFWGLETSAINSYILYKVSCNKNGEKPITHLRFIRKLVLS